MLRSEIRHFSVCYSVNKLINLNRRRDAICAYHIPPYAGLDAMLPFGQPALFAGANQACSLGPSGDDQERKMMSGSF